MSRRDELINLRIYQAKMELEGKEFTYDQYSMLCMALDNISHAIRESHTTPKEPT